MLKEQTGIYLDRKGFYYRPDLHNWVGGLE